MLMYVVQHSGIKSFTHHLSIHPLSFLFSAGLKSVVTGREKEREGELSKEKRRVRKREREREKLTLSKRQD